jgi:hypothetical protein|tara:strand:+ start:989 stop:1951 length:963 start_codon:yes stop_codon:yes gene_type:complete
MPGVIISKQRFKNRSTWLSTNKVGNLKTGDCISISITTKDGKVNYNQGEKFIIMNTSKKGIQIKGVLNYIKKYKDIFEKAEWYDIKLIVNIQSYIRKYNVFNTYLFSIVDVDIDIIDINLLKKYIKNEFNGTIRRDMAMEENANLKIESDISEYWISKCTNGKRVGKGNGKADVETNNRNIDVACLCLNGNITNEKSIIQDFKFAGNELDIYFKDKNDKKAVDLYKKTYYSKVKDISNMYYYIFISTKKKIYFCTLKLNISAIFKIKSRGFTKQYKSIYIDNIIENKYGDARLYSSKKRIELRLRDNIISKSVEIYDIDK